jgi:hypothetical protein
MASRRLYPTRNLMGQTKQENHLFQATSAHNKDGSQGPKRVLLTQVSLSLVLNKLIVSHEHFRYQQAVLVDDPRPTEWKIQAQPQYIHVRSFFQ